MVRPSDSNPSPPVPEPDALLTDLSMRIARASELSYRCRCQFISTVVHEIMN